MILNLNALDSKSLNGSQWVLCKGNLQEYLTYLKPTFFQFIIQRKIVKNKYLNTLINTVMSGEPLPVITLTTNKVIYLSNIQDLFSLEMEDVEILDGLQRTFRLWAYNKMITEYQVKTFDDAMQFAKHIKDIHPEFFDSGIMTLTQVKEYFTNRTFEKILTAFKNYDVYFIVWGSLDSKKVIHKMLVLNAGQRPVSLTHQYELLFLYVWEEISSTSIIKLYRERDPIANKIKLGNREPGEFMFSSIIAGLRSFLENKPKRISVDDLDLEDLQYGESGQINEAVFTKPYIEAFLNKLIIADSKIIDTEHENGRKWFVRDTTLSGVLAGLGKYIKVNESMSIEEIDSLTTSAFNQLVEKISKNGFRLNIFFDEYYNLQSRTVNVGTHVRKIIMDYTFDLLNDNQVSWKQLFEKSK